MTVNELIQLLQQVDPNTLVIMSNDEEGNEFKPTMQVSTDYLYVQDDHSWSGNIYPRELTDAHYKSGYTEEDLYDGDDAVPCVVIWP